MKRSGRNICLTGSKALADGALGDVATVAQARVDGLGDGAVFRRVGRVVVVEGDAEIGKVALVRFTDAGNQLLGADALLLGAQHDGRAVGIVGAHVMTFMVAQFLKAHPDVGLDVFDQVPDVDGSIGIRQGTGDQDLACGGHSLSVRREMSREL
jgi:hypothetical protein